MPEGEQTFSAACLPIVNSALTLVGTRLVSTVNDTSKECTLVKVNWDTYRRALLRMGIWKFAKEYVQLNSDTSYQPIEAGQKRFAVPADFIRLVSFNDVKGDSDGTGQPWYFRGGYIYTQFSYCKLAYIADVTDVTTFDPLFCEALSAMIYTKLCKTLTGTDADPKTFARALQQAKFVGSVEDPSVQLDVDVWLQSRVGIGGFFRDPNFTAESTPDMP